MGADTAVARPYAEAAFAHAQEAGSSAEWGRALGLLADLAGDDGFADALRRPGVGRDRLFALALAALGGEGDVPADFVRFVRVLVDNGRLGQAPGIRDEFARLQRERDSVLRVEVRSAFEADQAQLDAIGEALRARHGAGARLEFDVRVDPELIGGARVRVGDDVIDMSIRGRLERLARAIRH